MLISYKWLKKYLPDFEIGDNQNFKDKLDVRLSEVESLSTKGLELSNLLIGQIVDVKDHPTNQKLKVCTVEVGREEKLTIACGAPNVKTGMKSVVCVPGGKIYKPGTTEVLTITEKGIGKITSQGVLCSAAELGISEDHSGIIAIATSMPVGTPVKEIFQDVIIEIENKSLPHRPDAFGHIGIARELSAIFKTRFEYNPNHTLKFDQHEHEREVKVEIQTKHCNRYSGISIVGVEIGPSPLWLQTALSYAGVRPINNVVDITNYIMLDLGQPLHAFDLDKLSGDIVVRDSRKKEQIITLDGEQRELSPDSMVITDKSGPIALAGIMGGENTEISNDTTNIFIEAANFDMFNVRRTSRAMGLRTDASTRFEKGLDSSQTVTAVYATAKMVIDVCGGHIASELVDVYPTPEQPKVIRFDLGQVKRLIGIDLNKNTVLDTLRKLNIEILDGEKIAADALIRKDLDAIVSLQIPSYRRDLKAQEDILEEVARMYGYENIETTIPNRNLHSPLRNKYLDLGIAIRKTLANTGLTEIYTYSMVGSNLYEKCLLNTEDLVKIPQPISPELKFVRDQLAPSLIEKVNPNSLRYSEFGLMELAKVAHNRIDPDTDLPTQYKRLAGLTASRDELKSYRWLKYSLEQVSSKLLNHKLVLKPASDKEIPNYLHPTKSAEIWVEDSLVGYIGILHPLVAENMSIRHQVALFELDYSELFETKSHLETMSKLSSIAELQPVMRDLSLWKPERTYIQNLIAEIQNQQVNLLDRVEVVDLFTDPKSGRESVTVRLIIQPRDRTLEQADIEERVDQVIKISRKLKYEIRS